MASIMPALDVSYDRCLELINELSGLDGIFGFKIGSLLVWENGLSKFKDINVIKVFDPQKGATDIPSIIEKQVELVAKNNFQFMIGSPIGAGQDSLRKFVEACFNNKINPIVVVEMSHSKALSYSSLKNCEKLARDYAELGGKYIVAPATKPKRITAYKQIGEKYGDGFVVISPGVGPQRTGDVVMDAMNAVEYGADIIVIGRAIYNSRDPRSVVKNVYEQIKSIKSRIFI